MCEYLRRTLAPRRESIRNDETLSPETIAQIVLGCLEDKKAADIRVLHVAEATILADYFVIASIDNSRQGRAISNQIHAELKARGLMPLGIEGRNDGQWILLDYGPVVVHVMHPEARQYYDLENYWGDAPVVQLEAVAPTLQQSTEAA